MIASSTLGGQRERTGAHRHTILDAICVAVLTAYFPLLCSSSATRGFREDEMMNMGISLVCRSAEVAPGKHCILKLFLCSGRRPLRSASLSLSPGRRSLLSAALSFLWPDPLPYRIVQISILAASIPPGLLLESAARLFALDRLSRCPCSLLPPAASRRFVFVGAFIYDVLGGFFYFAALAYYIHIREKDVSLRPAANCWDF